MSRRKGKRGWRTHTLSLPHRPSSVVSPNGSVSCSSIISKHCTHGLNPIFVHPDPGQGHFQHEKFSLSFSRRAQHPPTLRQFVALSSALPTITHSITGHHHGIKYLSVDASTSSLDCELCKRRDYGYSCLYPQGPELGLGHAWHSANIC